MVMKTHSVRRETGPIYVGISEEPVIKKPDLVKGDVIVMAKITEGKEIVCKWNDDTLTINIPDNFKHTISSVCIEFFGAFARVYFVPRQGSRLHAKIKGAYIARQN